MNIVSYIWSGFSIPEWGGNWYLSVEEIEKVQKLVAHWGGEWKRLPHEWIEWKLTQGINEDIRLKLQKNIRELLMENSQRKELFLRWVGVRSVLSAVFTMNEHIQ